MIKAFCFLMFLLFPMMSFAETNDIIQDAESLYNATRVVCSGISDEIAHVANISKANTVITTTGTVTAGGALVAGIKKSQKEKEIESLINDICENGGCDIDKVNAMSDAEFFEKVMQPFAEIAELQNRIEQSKKFGNWRTGLMAGTAGANLASAIISGLNIDQSDLVQHITACNEMVKNIADMEIQLKMAGVNPMENPIVNQLGSVSTWCNQIDINDIEKVEKRMKGVMGTSIAGTAIGVVGAGTSAMANSNKYMDISNKTKLSEQDKKKEQVLNTTANVMAGANVATGTVETGLNISLIALTNKLIASAQRCEGILK